MWGDVRRFYDLVALEGRNYVWGLIALFFVNLFDVLSPVFMAVAVDLLEAALRGGEAQTTPFMAALGFRSEDFSILGAVLAYLFLQVGTNLARYPMVMRVAVPSNQIAQVLRNRFVDHLLKLSQSFYDKARSGDLMALATNDIKAVRMALGPGVLVGADTLIVVALVIVVLFTLSWKLTLVAMIPLPLIAIFTNKISHAEHESFAEVQEDMGDLTERARESFSGVRVIQGYAREPFDLARFQRFSARHFQKNLKLAKVRSALDPTLDFSLGISTLLVLVFGGIEVVEGTTTPGSFVAFLFLVRYLAGPMIGFGWTISLFQRGRASLHRLEKFMAERVEIYDAEGATQAKGGGELRVQGLSFSYEAGPEEALSPALHGIDFTLKPGKSLGVIGPVGSGKSTLVNMLVRLYEPPIGTVFLDGRDVRELTLRSLREHVVLAPQESFLFGDTVSRNVTMARGELSQQEVEKFTKLASLHEELENLSSGYGTLLGERGVNLSGGQRQRLALARAMAAQPRVLVLDDCLSAVDARTEEEILHNLQEVLQGRTGIIVSHRVCAVQGCDEILVLEEGRISERGKHEDLVNAGGYYAEIAQEQSRGAAE